MLHILAGYIATVSMVMRMTMIILQKDATASFLHK